MSDGEEFKTTDFVQVEHIKCLESGEPCVFWRNALYVEKNQGHVVIYTDGTREELNPSPMSCKIRKGECR